MTFGLVATRGAGYLLDFLDDAAAAGGRVIAQTHCRGISVLLSFKTRVPFDSAARVARVSYAARGRAAARRCGIPSGAAHSSTRPRTPTYATYRGVGAQARPPDFEGIRVYRHGLPPNPSVADVARERGVHPVEAMVDLAVETDFEQLFIQPSLYAAGRRGAAACIAPPAGGDDVLRFRRAPEPDRRLVDPHPPAGLLGARPRGVHARGGGPDDHAGARAGVGILRPRSVARGHGGRPQRLRSASASGRPCPGWSTTCPAAGGASCNSRSGSGRRSSTAWSRSTTASRPATRPAGSSAATSPDRPRTMRRRTTRRVVLRRMGQRV